MVLGGRRWVAFAASLAVVALVVAVGAPMVRREVRASILRRCEAATAARCTVRDVSIARDGVVVRGLEIVPPAPYQWTARVSALAVELDWGAAILGGAQDIALRVRGVSVEAHASPARLAQWLGEVRGRRSAGHSGRVRLARAEVDGVEMEWVTAAAVSSDPAAEAAEIAVAVHRGALRWTRGGGLEVECGIARAAVSHGASVEARQCVATQGRAGEPHALSCAGFAVDADAERLAFDRDALASALREGRDAWSRATGVAPANEATSVDARSAGPAGEWARSAHVQLQGGSVALRRGRASIAALRPASLRLEVDDGVLREAHFRVEGDGDAVAAEAHIEHPAGRPWRVDLNAEELPLAELSQWVPGVPWHGVEHGRASVRMRAEPGDADGVVVVDGEASLEDFGLVHAGLSHDPIDGLSVTLRGAARIDLPRRRIESEGVRVGFNGVTTALAGWAQHQGDRTALDATFRLPQMSCDAIRRAVPRGVAGPVADMVFAGTIAADVHLALDTAQLSSTQLDLDVDDRCAVARDGMAQSLHRLGRPFVQRVHEPQGLRAFVTGPGSAAWVALADISPYVTRAVLSREDGGFYRHHGFNVTEIRGAIVRDVGARRFVYGASTISMQLAKNVFLAREKTLVRKLQEVVLTWYLERSLDKDSILELYLNVVEFGPGIYGIGPASRFFFDREPRDLTPLQAIYLATLLPNPTARFVNFQRGAVGPDTLARLRAIARGMGASGALAPAEVAFAQSESVVFRPASTPVRGAVTQTVDPSTTDLAAESMAPPRAPVTEAPANSEEGAGGEQDGEDAAPSVRPIAPPVSVRTGGTL